jgi:chemotaxis signal transduction protein
LAESFIALHCRTNTAALTRATGSAGSGNGRMRGYHRGMEESGQRAGRRHAGTSGGDGGRRRGVPSEAGLRRLIAAWASDVQPDAPADAGAQEAERPEPDGRLLQCTIGGGAFALPLAAVTEVVPYTPPRRLPGQPADAGVTVLRGRPLPALDAAARMGIGEAGADGRMVVLATSSGACAAIVDGTGDIVEVARSGSRRRPPGRVPRHASRRSSRSAASSSPCSIPTASAGVDAGSARLLPEPGPDPQTAGSRQPRTGGWPATRRGYAHMAAIVST